MSAGTSSARARHDRRVNLELEEVLVSIVCGFDVHRDQITFDLVDVVTARLGGSKGRLDLIDLGKADGAGGFSSLR